MQDSGERTKIPFIFQIFIVYFTVTMDQSVKAILVFFIFLVYFNGLYSSWNAFWQIVTPQTRIYWGLSAI